LTAESGNRRRAPPLAVETEIRCEPNQEVPAPSRLFRASTTRTTGERGPKMTAFRCRQERIGSSAIKRNKWFANSVTKTIFISYMAKVAPTQ
jgi:hypothetical protein